MKYDLKQNGSELTVVVKGRLDTATAPELEAALKPLLSEVNHIIYDFEGLEYISSAGLRVLSFAHKNMRMGGVSEAIHCNDVIKTVFEVTGFTNIFPIR